MASTNKIKLLDAPFKDYTIIAKDGREIQVHKPILWAECNMFKALFSNTALKQENFIQTTHEYDDLLEVVRWMYGSSITYYTNEIYAIVDHFEITTLLDWRLHIQIDIDYISRFSGLESGEIEPRLVEERNYSEIYDAVILTIAKSCFATIHSEIDNVYIYTKCLKTVPSDKIEYNRFTSHKILYTLSIRMLKSWIQSKYRVNDESDVMYILKKYIEINPESRDVVKTKLMTLVNMSLTNSLGNKSHLENESCMRGPSTIPPNPIPYFQILTQFTWYFATGYEIAPLYLIDLPESYEDYVCDMSVLHQVEIDDAEDVPMIMIKDIVVSYQDKDGYVCSIPLHEIVKSSDEYNELLAVRNSFIWRSVSKMLDVKDELRKECDIFPVERKRRRRPDYSLA